MAVADVDDQEAPLLGTQTRKRKTKRVNFQSTPTNSDSEVEQEKAIRKEPTGLTKRLSSKGKKGAIGYFTRGLSFSHCDAAPYGGKIYLARRKKPDSWFVVVAEIVAVFVVIAFAVYAYHYLENVIFHVERIYAHAGHSQSQHQIGQRSDTLFAFK